MCDGDGLRLLQILYDSMLHVMCVCAGEVGTEYAASKVVAHHRTSILASVVWSIQGIGSHSTPYIWRTDKWNPGSHTATL